ncbi:hypothetical protein KUTeg_020570 [Tegillarca granosa]|uniref:DUF4371 domain-containing protein n=1 Tax=Tegillarca granosa TaxID=220873 RepID=A0ABQ9E8A1_TEGGR|nr:hypothetical protein KUTeg_020570 [Tegillarca granosa]
MSKNLDETAKRRENVSFSKFKNLCQLQVKNGVDLGTMYQNVDGCINMIKSIAATEKSKFISVLADGSTDSAVIEQETVYVRFEDGLPKTQFVDIVPLSSANSDGVLKGIDTGLENIGLTREKVDSKIVGCNFDGASVMMGNKSGVSSKIKERLRRGIIMIHCVAHNLELAVLDAVKGISYLSTLNLLFNRRELVEIASVLEEASIKQTGLQKTRWVASRHRALVALEKSFPTVVYYFNHSASTGKGEDQAKAKGIVKELCSERFVRFLHFMIDLTKVLSDISKQFQNDHLFISDVSVKLEVCLLKLLELKDGKGKFTTQLTSNLCNSATYVWHN